MIWTVKSVISFSMEQFFNIIINFNVKITFTLWVFQKLMLAQLFKFYSLLRVSVQTFFYEINRILAHVHIVCRENYLSIHNLMQVIIRPNVERNLSNQKFVSQNTNRPNISWLIVLFFLDHFWRKIKRRSTKWLSHLIRTAFCSPSHVTYFCDSLNNKKKLRIGR